MKREGPVPCSREPITGFHLAPNESSPPFYSRSISVTYYSLTDAGFSQVTSSLRFSNSVLYLRMSHLLHMLRARPISSVSFDHPNIVW
jgi:hypothetical protein